MGSKPFQILCVNLSDQVFAEMQQHLLEGCEAKRLLYTDHEAIKDGIKNYRAIYFNWDGMTGNAHRMVQALRLRAKRHDTKLCVILEHPDSNLKIAKRRVSADEWIDLATERYRIESSLYSVVYDDYGNDRRKAEAFLGPQLEIPIPDASPLDDTIRRIRESFKKLEVATSGVKNTVHSWTNPKTQDAYDVTWPLTEPVIYLRPESGKALELEESLKALGFCRLIGTATPEKVVRQVRDRGLRWLVCWFSEFYTKPIPMLSELLENRELGRFVTSFVFPGESAVQQFLKEGGPIFHDSVNMLPNKADQLKALVNKAFACLQDKGHVSNIFFDFRNQWQPCKGKRRMKTQNEWTHFVKAVQDAPGNKSYWSLSDSALYWLTRGEVAKAQKLYDQLRATYNDKFDCGMIGAFITAKTHSTTDAANSILSLVQAHKAQMTSSRLFRVGLTLARWKRQEQLMSFLEFWNELFPRTKDHHLWFITSLFYANCKDVAKRKSYLYPAVAEAPLRGQYLSELASFLTEEKEYQKAGVVWQYAARCHDTNKVDCLCEAAIAFHQAGRKDDAQKLVAILQELAPSNHRVANLKDELAAQKAA